MQSSSCQPIFGLTTSSRGNQTVDVGGGTSSRCTAPSYHHHQQQQQQQQQESASTCVSWSGQHTVMSPHPTAPRDTALTICTTLGMWLVLNISYEKKVLNIETIKNMRA